MKVNWATSPSNQPKQDTSSEYRIFMLINGFSNRSLTMMVDDNKKNVEDDDEDENSKDIYQLFV